MALPSPTKAVLFDLAGVLYEGDEAVPGAVDALRRLRGAEISYRMVTNTSRSPKAAVVRRLNELGFDVAADHVFTPAIAARRRLEQAGLVPALLIHPALEEDFAGLALGPATAVLVGDAAERFTYAALNAAFRLLMEGAPLLALATNRYFREPDGLSLDAGPFVAALAYAADVEAEVLGKPAADFYRAVLDDLGVAADAAIMIGDDVEADVNGAIACGTGGILVKTGKYRSGDEGRLVEGGQMVADVAAAVDMILSR